MPAVLILIRRSMLDNSLILGNKRGSYLGLYEKEKKVLLNGNTVEQL